jgi:transcriptional regulator with XRE-family HTH domain
VTAATIIRDARRRAGISQAELGRRVGIPGSAIGRWERAEVEPAFTTVADLLDALGFTLVLSGADDGDHDRALIRRSLARTPAERLAELTTGVRALDEMSSVAARNRARG